MKRLTALIIVAIMLTLTACNNGEGVYDDPKAKPIVDNSDEIVMSYDGCTLTSGMYAFIFSALKTNYLYLLQLYGETNFIEDTEAFWNIKTDEGITFAKAVTEDIDNHCKMLLICDKMSKEYKVSLNDEQLEAAAYEYNDYISAYGSEKALGVFLNRYGINESDLLRYLQAKQMIVAVQNKVCSDGGICEVKTEEVNAQIEKNYVKAKHIFLLDSEYDNKAIDKANEFLSQINSGDKKYSDFTSLSYDDSNTNYPDGFLVNINEAEEGYAELIKTLDVGDCGVCKADDGAYLVTKVEMTESDIMTMYQEVWQEIADSQFVSVLDDRYNLVELNREELDKYDIVTADVLQ